MLSFSCLLKVNRVRARRSFVPVLGRPGRMLPAACFAISVGLDLVFRVCGNICNHHERHDTYNTILRPVIGHNRERFVLGLAAFLAWCVELLGNQDMGGRAADA